MHGIPRTMMRAPRTDSERREAMQGPDGMLVVKTTIAASADSDLSEEVPDREEETTVRIFVPLSHGASSASSRVLTVSAHATREIAQTRAPPSEYAASLGPSASTDFVDDLFDCDTLGPDPDTRLP